MRYTFGLFDMGVKDKAMVLINERKNFTVTLVKDNMNEPHHWVIEVPE